MPEESKPKRSRRKKAAEAPREFDDVAMLEDGELARAIADIPALLKDVAPEDLAEGEIAEGVLVEDDDAEGTLRRPIVPNELAILPLRDSVRLIVQGVVRFRVTEWIEGKPYLRAKVELLEEEAVTEASEEIEALKRSIGSLFESAVRLSPVLPEELRSLTSAVQEVNVMTDLVAAHMTLDVESKQKILETLDLKERMRALVDMLAREVRVLELSNKVNSEVNTELSKNQRDFYLREQLKAIQRELGEDDGRGEELEE
ncbi:hypothetical protein EON77_16185, partial [bacterium]